MGRALRRLAIFWAAASLLGGAAAVRLSVVSGKVEGVADADNLLVYVVKAPGHFTPPTRHRVMDQRHMHFVPKVLPVVRGTTVDFLNSDDMVHNVFSPDHEGYNLGNWPPGQRRSYTFTKLGVYTQLCSLHPTMEAYVVVLQNPYFTLTDDHGRFRLPELPDGRYQLAVWGRALTQGQQARRFTVRVHGGRVVATLDLAGGTGHGTGHGQPAHGEAPRKP